MGSLVEPKWNLETGDSVNFVKVLEKKEEIIFVADHSVFCADFEGGLKWKYDTEGYIGDLKVLKDGTGVFVPSSENLYCLNDEGRVNWKTPIKNVDMVRVSPNEDMIYAGGKESLFAQNMSGEDLWSKSLDKGISCMISNSEAVFVSYKNGGLEAFSNTGESLWNIKKKDPVVSMHPLGKTSLIVGTRKGSVSRIDGKGNVVWKYDLGIKIVDIRSLPRKNKIWIGGKGGEVLALGTKAGKVLFKTQVSGEVSSIHMSPKTGYPIVSSSENILYGFSNDGNVDWSLKFEDWINDLDLFADGDGIALGCADTSLYIIGDQNINIAEKEATIELVEDQVEEPEPENKSEVLVSPKPEEETNAEEIEPFVVKDYPLPVVEEEQIVSMLSEYLHKEKYMLISLNDVKNIFYSLKSQPFLILCGRPGLGKTKLTIETINAFREAIYTPEHVNEVFIPIHHEFNETDLWGYVNLNDEYIPSALAKALFFEGDRLKPVEQLERDHRLYFIVLDEMNLSQPDYYMTKLLTAIENGKPIQLPTGKENGNIVYRPLPKNTYVIGTINSYVAESTREKLSGGLKRRANIFFVPNSMDKIFDLSERKAQKQQFSRALTVLLQQVKANNDINSMTGMIRAKDLKELALDKKKAIFTRLFNVVEVMHQQEETKLTLGVVQDMLEYLVFSNDMSIEKGMDYQIQQKIIPQITGNVRIIDDLIRVPGFKADYPSSFTLLTKMKKDATGNMNIIVSPV